VEGGVEYICNGCATFLSTSRGSDRKCAASSSIAPSPASWRRITRSPLEENAHHNAFVLRLVRTYAFLFIGAIYAKPLEPPPVGLITGAKGLRSQINQRGRLSTACGLGSGGHRLRALGRFMTRKSKAKILARERQQDLGGSYTDALRNVRVHTHLEGACRQLNGKPVSTALTALDALLGGGIPPGAFMLVASYGSSGRSSFVEGLARQFARAGNSVLFASSEMSGIGLTGARCMC
jgi:hypothetical protein